MTRSEETWGVRTKRKMLLGRQEARGEEPSRAGAATSVASVKEILD